MRTIGVQSSFRFAAYLLVRFGAGKPVCSLAISHFELQRKMHIKFFAISPPHTWTKDARFHNTWVRFYVNPAKHNLFYDMREITCYFWQNQVDVKFITFMLFTIYFL